MPTEAPESLRALTDYFASVPWCADILKVPGTVPFELSSRMDPANLPLGSLPSRDSFFRDSVNSEDTLPHLLGLYQDPFYEGSSEANNHKLDLPFLIRYVSVLFDLRAGLGGFSGTAHGGFVGAIVDEAMGALIFQNDILNMDAKDRGLIPASAKDFASFVNVTARMEVSYRRPLVLPQIVAATASLDRVEGRKTYISVTVRGAEGHEYATGLGTWVSIPRPKM